ncbi:fimbria/pilus outer membrane usher protein [Serratia fonticola]|uniref:fimbria/pilus outer membrane usher protein n=1 Tax=Serratia fonticola TaxID=47917 RepID=UPI0021BDAC91|nr:fimbria/pilus outer membrane usher protein [Serratia fonticola]
MVGCSSALADDYFDPAFLSIIGDDRKVDLSTFAQSGGMAEGRYPVSVFINQRDTGRYVLEFSKNAQGIVTPQLTPALLENLGVNVPNIPVLKVLPPEQPVEDLPALIPQATVQPDIARLRLDLSIPQVAMKPDVYGSVDPTLWDDGVMALLANYNLSAGHSSLGSGGSSNNLFATLRAGANAGPWRVRSTMTHNRTENEGGENTTTQNTRFTDTYLARDLRAIRAILLAGESSTGSDVFDSVPFRGVKLSSNEEMLPSQLRGYAPAISGIANSNARVTVRQNGNVVYETYVAPGPFSLTDVQQAGLSGDYDVTVTEANGVVRSFVVPYSSLPVMLRPGSVKYEITAGRYDGSMTTDSRRAEFVLSTLVYGLPKGITLYGGLLAAEYYQSLSVGSGVSMGDIGAISADITASSALFNDDDQRRAGQSYRVRYSKSLMSTGTSVDLTALRYSTREYYSFSEFNSQGYSPEEGVNPWLMQRRRSSFQTQLSQQLGELGSLNLRASRDNYWGSERTLTGLSVGYSNSWRGASYGVNYNIDRMKDSNSNWPENRQLSLNVSVPFSLFGYAPALQSMYATASTTRDNNGRMLSQAGISGSAMDNALSYSVSQSVGNQGQAANSNLNTGWQGSKGSVSAGYNYSQDSQTFNMNAAGGVLVHSDGVTLSRAMGESVALVSAPGAAGVSVGNGTAVTDSRGYAVVPYLSPYMKNNVGLNPASLPEGVDVKQSDLNVYPTNGAVVKANFATRVGYQVLITLKHPGGLVPFGAVASLVNPSTNEELGSIVGDAGQVYLNGLPEQGTLLVKWGEEAGRQCRANFDLRGTETTPERPVREAAVNCIP